MTLQKNSSKKEKDINKSLAIKDKSINPTKSLTKKPSFKEMEEKISHLTTAFDPKEVIRKAYKEIGDCKDLSQFEGKNPSFWAMGIDEFKNGILMISSLPEIYRTFSIAFNQKLQEEYNCQTASEKSLAEMSALNYARVLSIQRRVNNYLEMGTINDNGYKFLKIMSLELDRANRHYLASLQTLKSIKQPPMQLNIKTNTAVVGTSQVVQVNENEINKTK